jgi:two-component system, NtrC family, sensor histidine kinase PilS
LRRTVDWSLESRLKRLMLFRLVMITTLLLIAAYVEAVSETLFPVNPLYFLIVAVYVLTLLYALALRFLPVAAFQVYGQVVGDLLVITGLVYVYGGVRTSFILLYPLSVLSGSVLLDRKGGVVLASLASVFYAALLLALRLGLVRPQGLSDVPFLPSQVIVYSAFVTAVACGAVGLIGAQIAENLRHAGEKLEQAEGQVADLQELNEVIVNSIHSGLLTCDAAGHILHVNSFGESILGRTAESTRGRNVREVFGSWLLEPHAVEARAARSMARLEVSYDRPDGATVELGVSVTPLATGNAVSPGYLLVFQDLTDIKRLEQEVRTKEKLAAVGEMTAQLAHEIRNPLGSISGSAQVLMTEPNISPEQERLLAIITRESKRLSDTLNRFLFQARSPGRPLEPVDIGPLIGEAITLLRNGPEVGPDHGVEFESDAGPHVCMADPDQIAQVFWNLARNGLEAMPRGGVLRIALRQSKDEVVLSVRDQGRGMDREEQRTMFEPFQSRSGGGTGLGLSIVYRIIREHGGDITVRSFPHVGTDVQVRLPLVSVLAPS